MAPAFSYPGPVRAAASYPGLQRAAAAAFRGQYAQESVYQGQVRAAVGLPRASTRRSWITKGKYAQESRYPGLVRAGAAAVRGQYAQQFLYPGPVRAFGADLLAPDESGQPLVVSPPRVQAPGKSARGRARQNARERLPALDKEKPRNREDSGVFTRAMRGIS